MTPVPVGVFPMGRYLDLDTESRLRVHGWVEAHGVEYQHCFGFEARSEGGGRPVIQFWTYSQPLRADEHGEPVRELENRVQVASWPTLTNRPTC